LDRRTLDYDGQEPSPDSITESERTEFGRIAFGGQNGAQKVFSSIWELESQVNNGGLDAYLRYTDSEVVSYAPIALREVGAMQCCAIVERALQLVAPLPSTRRSVHVGGERRRHSRLQRRRWHVGRCFRNTRRVISLCRARCGLPANAALLKDGHQFRGVSSLRRALELAETVADAAGATPAAKRAQV